MTEWINSSLANLSGFFAKHSLLFKNDERNLSQDALIKIAELYAIIAEMESRNEYSFIKEDYFKSSLSRITWLFRQLLIEYRINYKEFSQFEDDINRFFKVDPTGKIVVDQRIYNIPKHYANKGMYPNLSEGTWVKEYEGKWD